VDSCGRGRGEPGVDIGLGARRKLPPSLTEPNEQRASHADPLCGAVDLPFAHGLTVGALDQLRPKLPGGELAHHPELVGRARMLVEVVRHPPVEASQPVVALGQQADGDQEPSDMVGRATVLERVEPCVGEWDGAGGEAMEKIPGVTGVEPDDDPVGACRRK